MRKKEKTKKTNFYYIHTFITILIMLGFGLLRAPDPITPLGMKIIGIFLGMIYGWSTVGQIWPSIFGIILLGLSGYGTVASAITDSWGNPYVFLFIMIFAISALISTSGISEIVTTWLLSRKQFQNKPWLFTFVFLIITFIIAAFVNPVVAIFLCWGIMYDISRSVGYEKGDNWPAFMIFGITIASLFGMASLPYQNIPLVVFGIFKSMGGAEINYLSYIVVSWGISFMTLIIFTMIGKVILKIDASKLKVIDEKIFDGKSGKFNNIQKLILLLFIVMIVLLFASNLLPATWKLTILLNSLSAPGIVAIFAGLMVLIKVKGRSLLNFSEMAKVGIQWETILLTAASLVLAGALTSQATGVNEFLLKIAAPILSGKSVLLFTILAVIIPIVITNFTNNGVTAIVFVSVLVNLCASIGANPIVIVVLVVFAVHVAVLTPAACPMAAMMFSNVEWIKPSLIYKYAAIFVFITTLIILVYGIPIANLLF